ncbi:tripartite tricarboxylate transporter permease [Aquibaculum arenosum]|uniref:Tripartite tricarboxylate transporter permease n=1 Tax=Aquibaculum arenosum TaxID=3032591 RepID=A0ABT5YPH2_9PROT|nr:tripartite tricarboxylate transporter permease [Fodinicurvata sp. CAU 1616]MDF2096872.1 tripartite tricarboxylate transporter permease [Fodinicurvata sp. CAU 1616]
MDGLLQALPLALSLEGLLFTLIGTTLGILVGSIPGLSGTMLIALSLPLTFTMSPALALMMLVGMYVGSVAGGLISATLLRMPGTPASVLTTLDGYPMARAGRPGRALALGITASFVGGLVSWVALILVSRPLADFALRFTPWDYFAFIMVAMVLIASLSRGAMVKGLLSGFLGILIAMPGSDPSTGMPRLAFGNRAMENGFDVLPVLIGLFAVSQIMRGLTEHLGVAERIEIRRERVTLSLADWRRHGGNMLRSSTLGTLIGILPGVGANVGSVVAYSTARSFSKEPERFGTGSEEAVIASEAGNSATVGGALVPLVAIGIPGSVIDAILIGGLYLHGIVPGPMLFSTNPDVVYAIMISCLVATLMMFVLMTGLVRHLPKLARVDRSLLLPGILVFCIVGSYAATNRFFDVWVMLAFGVLGFLLEKARVPLAPLVIGFILGPLAEAKLRTGLMITAGDPSPLVTQPLPAFLMGIALLLLLWPLLSRLLPPRLKPGARPAGGSGPA